MATLPNPWGPMTPIGASMQNLVQSMFAPSNVDPTKQDYNRAAAAKLDAETSALYRKQNAMSGIGNMTRDIVSGPMPEAAPPSPEFVGPMPTMPREQYLASQIGDINSAGLRAGLDPTKIGQLMFQTARQANMPTEVVARYSPDLLPLDKGVTLADRDALIRQDNAAKTGRVIAAEQAKPVRVGEGDFVMMPPNDPRGSGTIRGLPTLNTVRGSVAENAMAAGELSPMGERILGGSQGTPRNYVAPGGQQGITKDGVTDASTGAPIPQGSTVYTGQLQSGSVGDLTKSVQTGIQKDTLAATRFRTLLGQTREVAAKDPTNFGIPGYIKGTAQDMTAMGQGLAAGLGYNGINEAMSDISGKIARSGVDPSLLSGVFDTNLPALQTMSDLLVYSAAETLAGQEGRSVSDRDVKLFKQIAGDPSSWMMSQQKYLAKLKIMEDVINGRTGATQKFVDQSKGGAQAKAPPAVGMIEDGYRFKGGNPADPSAWEKVQ